MTPLYGNLHHLYFCYKTSERKGKWLSWITLKVMLENHKSIIITSGRVRKAIGI